MVVWEGRRAHHIFCNFPFFFAERWVPHPYLRAPVPHAHDWTHRHADGREMRGSFHD